MLTAEERRWLDRAVELGRRGWGRVHPNPMAGCVLVKDGAVVGEGWHEVFGGPHAEPRALADAGPDARGATAYVSLEPCRHEGKTPACTGALLSAGVARVVYGAADPGAESGGGGAELAGAGVDVVGPALDDEAAYRENAAFFHAAWTGSPFVALKLALSLDGGIAARKGERTGLTGPEARREVHRLRAGFDAVLVGAGTARVDDPLLTVREDVAMGRPPVRLVLDPDATLPSDAALFRDTPDVPLGVFVREEVSEAEIERLEEAGASVHPVPGADRGVSIAAVLEDCWRLGHRAVLCEGGARLAASLLAEGRVGRQYLLYAPRLLGPRAVRGFDLDPERFGARWHPSLEPRALGEDVLITLDRLPRRRRDARTSAPESP